MPDFRNLTFNEDNMVNRSDIVHNRAISVHEDNILDRIHLDKHAPNWERMIEREKLEQLIKTGEPIGMHVLIGDIRRSTLLMREAVSLKIFAEITRGFIKDVRKLAIENEAWFDKFTGDGFIVYWLYGNDPGRYAGKLLTFCQRLTFFFSMVVENYRMNSMNFPTGVGLSLGIDSGPCTFVEIEDLDIVGHPVVGAKRMVDAAGPYETLCNVYLGDFLSRNTDRLGLNNIHINKREITTSEYGTNGQEAYSIGFGKKC